MNGTFFLDLTHKDSPNTTKQKRELKKAMDKRYDKSIHAAAYIEYISVIFADTIPTDENKLALPYETLQQFYDEYESFCLTTLLLKETEFCKIETFRKVFIEHEHIRLVGCKGKQVKIKYLISY